MSRFSCLLLFALFPLPLLAADCVEASKDVSKGIALSDGSVAEEKHYRAAIRKCPSLAEAYFNLGIIADRKGEEEAAIGWYKKALEKRKDEDFLIALGSAYLQNKEWENAEEQFREVLKESERNTRALQGLAAISRAKGELGEAYSFLLRAHDYDPTSAQVAVNLAIVEEQLGKLEEALVSYEKALNRQPNNRQARLYRAQLLVRLERYREAVPALLSAAELLPENVEVFRALGIVRAHLDELEKAEIAFRKAVALEPSDEKTRVDLAEVLLRKEQPGLALEVLSDPAFPETTGARAPLILGRAHSALGEVSAAVAAFEKSVKRDPTLKEAHEELANGYRKLGKDELAEEHAKLAEGGAPQ